MMIFATSIILLISRDLTSAAWMFPCCKVLALTRGICSFPEKSVPLLWAVKNLLSIMFVCRNNHVNFHEDAGKQQNTSFMVNKEYVSLLPHTCDLNKREVNQYLSLIPVLWMSRKKDKRANFETY